MRMLMFKSTSVGQLRLSNLNTKLERKDSDIENRGK